MIRNWTRELAPRGITVNAIAPGIIRTRIHQRVGGVLLLASAEGSYITGQAIEINGGMQMPYGRVSDQGVKFHGERSTILRSRQSISVLAQHDHRHAERFRVVDVAQNRPIFLQECGQGVRIQDHPQSRGSTFSNSSSTTRSMRSNSSEKSLRAP